MFGYLKQFCFKSSGLFFPVSFAFSVFDLLMDSLCFACKQLRQNNVSQCVPCRQINSFCSTINKTLMSYICIGIGIKTMQLKFQSQLINCKIIKIFEPIHIRHANVRTLMIFTVQINLQPKCFCRLTSRWQTFSTALMRNRDLNTFPNTICTAI